MSDLHTLIAHRDALGAELDRQNEQSRTQPFTDEQERGWRALLDSWQVLADKINGLQARSQKIDGIRSRTHRTLDGTPRNTRTGDRTTDTQGDALRMLEENTDKLSARGADRVEDLVREDVGFAEYVAVHGSDAYNSAFGKVLIHGTAEAGLVMTDDERSALARAYSYRAQAEGSTTTGGFAVPVFIDPSVILTNQESGNPLLSLCRVEDVTTNVWKGISAAGVSWSFDAEAAEVSDDSITIAQPSVTVNMARGFIPYSIEVGDDWAGFQQEMARLLAAGYDELVASKVATGTGTGEPRGLITALDANTNDEVTPTTDGAFGSEDIYKVWEALPMKYRRNAAWFMSTSVMDRIRAMGDQTKWHANTVQLPAGAIDSLFNRAVFEQPYFPDFVSTTGAANILVVGDPSNYVVARRAGISVEVVPHLFGGSGRPTGSHGLFAWARIGANSVNDVGFRMLQNQ